MHSKPTFSIFTGNFFWGNILNTGKKSFFKRVLIFFAFIFTIFIILSVLVAAFSKKEQFGGPKVAVVRVEGVIVSSKKAVDELEKHLKNPTVKAIVLRVDSVGGGVAPSQEIHEEVERLKRAGKKVVVSMGSVAASGGYYISCGADTIFANPGTLTGSIGVLMEFSNVQDLMKKIGIKSRNIKSGKYKDIGSPLKRMTDEERKLLQSVIDDVYQQFVSAIAAGRNISKEDVMAVADGRIFSGKKAKELNFVDKLGGLQKAIEEAARLANMETYEVLETKEEKGFMKLLMGEFKGYLNSSITQSLHMGNKLMGMEYRWSY